jgi:site-specific recombinase XerD
MKGGRSGQHHITDKEIRYLKKLKTISPRAEPTDYIFYSQKGGNLGMDSFREIMKTLGKKIGIPFQIHPHMLRHGWGYKAINNNISLIQMQHHMGHCDIGNTAHYAALEVSNFVGLFKD